jgi:hypothetical protein
MKYFTLEWWASGDNGDVLERYEKHIADIRSRLPPAALTLDAEHTLHDSEIKNIRNDFARREVVLELLGFNQGLEYPVRYSLRFSEVTTFEQHYPQEAYVESELGDLGYWEWDLVPLGTELRMLFASSAEFIIVFKDLAFSHDRVQA